VGVSSVVVAAIAVVPVANALDEGVILTDCVFGKSHEDRLKKLWGGDPSRSLEGKQSSKTKKIRLVGAEENECGMDPAAPG
jgi:hypothetical protein